MTTKNKKEQPAVILNTSEDAAKRLTVTGWVSKSGRFWGEDERMARWDGCTHVECNTCGKPTPKDYLACESCRAIKNIQKHDALEKAEWDGETPLYSDAADKYFLDADDLHDHIAECGSSIEDLRLVICRPNYARQLETDYFADELPEDGDVSVEILEAMEAFNAVLAKQPPLSWSPGKYAADPASVRRHVTEPDAVSESGAE